MRLSRLILASLFLLFGLWAGFWVMVPISGAHTFRSAVRLANELDAKARAGGMHRADLGPDLKRELGVGATAGGAGRAEWRGGTVVSSLMIIFPYHFNRQGYPVGDAELLSVGPPVLGYDILD